MEWYCESEMEDLAVPKDEEIMDRLPSPDSWSSWGKVVGNFNSQNKLAMLGVEEYLSRENMFEQPNLSQGGSRRAVTQLRAAYPHERSDARLNDIYALDEADDIFFCSLFESDGSATNGVESSANFTQTSIEDNVTSPDDLSGERNHIKGRSNNVVHVGYFPHAMEPKFQGCVPEDFIDHEDISEEDISIEESVLLELQRLTVQLAKKTRMCFRDSLYRLAENSRHQAKCHQGGKEDLENCKPSTSSELSSLQESKAKEQDTKAVDRTVATLLFNTVNSCNFAEASSSGFTTETPKKEHSSNYGLYTVPGGDAEVPTFGLTKQTSKRKFGT